MKFHQLHGQGIALMESGEPGKIQAARALFQEQLNLFPDAPSPLYNIACCEALLGNPSEALSYLKKAVNAGYTNVSHIESDSDLKSLHELEEFKAIILSLKPTTTTATSSANTTPAPVEPTPVPSSSPSTSSAPVEPTPVPSAPPADIAAAPTTTPTVAPSAAPSVPPSSVPSADAQTLENMGFINKERNMAALQRANGDLTVAVQLLLQNNFGFNWF